ncbi:MAG: hypothetical protein A3F46_05990 [Legionellales bacterium RIFCSPHIGHO2_12_FULL_42_9]|nr:MAG: hypothetical protein A3F46_05990 [Legionellales bacterium RIFCSPHIGHO2_12_FULL_42_9]
MWYQAMSSTNDCLLQAGRVDVWQFPLHDAPTWAYALLNQAEQERANRYHFPKHQRRFTAARAMLRLILARYLKIDPRILTFTHNKHGKPYLNHNTENVQFNLSHSKDGALLAIGKNDELGIDLEYFSKRSFRGIAEHVFSLKEIHALTQLPEESQPLAFFTIWAQKEAFIKAVGMGLAYPLKEFDVPAHPGANSKLIDPLTKKTWHLISFMPEAACCAAVCVDPSVTEIRRIRLKTIAEFNQP